MGDPRSVDQPPGDQTVPSAGPPTSKAGLQELYEGSIRHRRWREATTAIITRLLRGAHPDDVLAEIADVAKELADADECGVRLADPSGSHLELTAAAGVHSVRATGETMPIEGTFLGAVYATGTSASTDDLMGLAPDDTLAVTRGVGPVLAVALIAPDRTIGTLSLSRYKGRPPFDPSDLELVESFAGQAAVALAFGEAGEVHERMALNDDRERIARDLHDLVIQRVFAAGLTLQSAATLLDPGPVKDRVTRVVEDLDDTIAELRTTIFALQSDGTRSSQLRRRVTELVQRSAGQVGFMPRLRITGEIDTRVGRVVADHLLAVLREAIANIVRHAGADRVHIAVDVGAELRLSVDDDGVGPPDGDVRHSGLANLEERANSLGGAFTVTDSDLGGTSLRWSAPL
jgi:signal transduction histidine kinase